MMESWVTISVQFPVIDQPKWQSLVEGLSSNEHGAYLEEYAEAFSEHAGEMVGYVLDVWEEERGEISTRSSEIFPGRADICIGGFRTVEPSIQPMIKFLKVCGATDVKLHEEYDSNGLNGQAL
ncbi:hypothetical protein QWZ13_08595 [Reinekea marina]|uniref:Uncharacterized protein n=1 Tax=Reinekea marina TaxID=1310421 RepID=A0ABV7WT82_9GAMM|nr:hypothetical protein [Reinekea marina]MDN3648967.1 hypothetical protein [Reinekea marina]